MADFVGMPDEEILKLIQKQMGMSDPKGLFDAPAINGQKPMRGSNAPPAYDESTMGDYNSSMNYGPERMTRFGPRPLDEEEYNAYDEERDGEASVEDIPLLKGNRSRLRPWDAMDAHDKQAASVGMKPMSPSKMQTGRKFRMGDDPSGWSDEMLRTYVVDVLSDGHYTGPTDRESLLNEVARLKGGR